MRNIEINLVNGLECILIICVGYRPFPYKQRSSRHPAIICYAYTAELTTPRNDNVMFEQQQFNATFCNTQAMCNATIRSNPAICSAIICNIIAMSYAIIRNTPAMSHAIICNILAMCYVIIRNTPAMCHATVNAIFKRTAVSDRYTHLAIGQV